MIIHIFFSIIIIIFNTVVSWLPTATVLPWGIDEILVFSVGMFKGMMLIFPPLEIVFEAFLAYLSFRLLIIIVTIFAGSRSPHHD